MWQLGDYAWCLWLGSYTSAYVVERVLLSGIVSTAAPLLRQLLSQMWVLLCLIMLRRHD